MIKDKINSIINPLLANKQPSGSILIATNKETIYQQSFGYADIEKRTSMLMSTQMLVGSVTKQFTAVALLKGLDESTKDIKADLNKTVAHYLPEEHEIWAGSMPTWAHLITVHQLLVHSSGIPNYTSIPDFDKKDLQQPSDIVTLFKNLPLEFTPGEKFAYCNSGYTLLGEILQKITSQYIDLYMQKVFFDPLGMKSTYFTTHGTVDSLIKSDPKFSKLARGYSFDIASKDTRLKEITDYILMQIPGAAGSLISTAEDLLIWNNALYGGQVIHKDLLNLMLEPYIITETENHYYGYGIEVIASGALGVYYSHGGAIPGFRSILSFIPSLKLSVIILENIVANRDAFKIEIGEIKAKLNQALSEDEKSKQADKILGETHPSIAENTQHYMLQPIHDQIMQASLF